MTEDIVKVGKNVGQNTSKQFAMQSIATNKIVRTDILHPASTFIAGTMVNLGVFVNITIQNLQ